LLKVRKSKDYSFNFSGTSKQVTNNCGLLWIIDGKESGLEHPKVTCSKSAQLPLLLGREWRWSDL